jgi:hypothetical protein
MLSLASTHIILHYHRKVHYHGPLAWEDGCDEDNVDSVDVATSMRSEEPPKEELGIKAVGNFSTRFMVVAVGALVASMILFVAGVTVETFTVTSTRGEISETIAYSIASIGMDIPEAYVIANHSGTQFIQFMWFFLGIATPLLCSALFLALYTIPTLTKGKMETIFTAGEITFAWRYVRLGRIDSFHFFVGVCVGVGVCLAFGRFWDWLAFGRFCGWRNLVSPPSHALAHVLRFSDDFYFFLVWLFQNRTAAPRSCSSRRFSRSNKCPSLATD